MNLHDTQDALSVRNARLTKATFVNAAMPASEYDDVNLAASRFTNVNLTGVTLDDVNLTNVSITNANLSGMRIEGVLVGDMMRAHEAMHLPRPGAVIYAHNVSELHLFYEKVFALKATARESDHVVLSAAAFQLVIVAIPARIAQTITVERPPKLRDQTPIKIMFGVTSINAVRSAARALGGNVLAPEREWEFDGNRVCDGNDPEGNVLQLIERLA